MFKQKTSQKRGLIILYIFLLTLTISAIMMSFAGFNFQDMSFFKDYENELKATWLAYGGIAKGYAKFSNEPSFRGNLPDITLDSGKIETKIQKNQNGKISITSAGIVNNVKIQAEKEITDPQTLPNSGE